MLSRCAILSSAASAVLVLGLSAAAPGAVRFEYDAGQDPAGDNKWTDQVDDTNNSFDKDLIFPSVASPTTITDSALFESAYTFGGTGLSGANAETGWKGFAQLPGASYEFWLRADSATADKRQVIIDVAGSGRGMFVAIDTDGSLQAGLKSGQNGSADPLLVVDSATSYEALLEGPEFVQVVFSLDHDSDSDTVTGTFYVNGVAAGTNSASLESLNYGGDDLSGIAQQYGNDVGGNDSDNGDDIPFGRNSFQAFSGDIALVRLYDSALSPTEVAATYAAVVVPEPASGALLLMGLGVLGSRRRRS